MKTCQKSRFLVCYEWERINEHDKAVSNMISTQETYPCSLYLHDELYIYNPSANSQISSILRYMKLTST